jgi:thiosulfate dehydrogenase [quinone] large subunit
MTALQYESPTTRVAPSDLTTDEDRSSLGRYALGSLRIVIGLTFLWAFFDKLLALGFSTGRLVDAETGVETVDRFGPDAWINGGSPTYGFLAFGANGPFDSFYHSIAGEGWANWLFMLGLLAIGGSLLLGIFTRLAAMAGVLMYLLMWSVVLPPENNPILDDHIIGALALIVLATYSAGRYLGLGRWWEQTALVQKYPTLK